MMKSIFWSDVFYQGKNPNSDALGPFCLFIGGIIILAIIATALHKDPVAKQVDPKTAVKVAIVSSGLGNNDLFQGHVWNKSNPNDFFLSRHSGKNFVSNETNTDLTGYGTMFGKLVAYSYNYEQPTSSSNSLIMPLKVVDSKGVASDKNIVEAVNYAVANKANVIFIPLTSPDYSTEIHDALLKASERNIAIIVPAGNQNKNLDQDPEYPASYVDIPNLITIGSAKDPEGTLIGKSNYGQTVDFYYEPESLETVKERLRYADSDDEDNNDWSTGASTIAAVSFISTLTDVRRRNDDKSLDNTLKFIKEHSNVFNDKKTGEQRTVIDLGRV